MRSFVLDRARAADYPGAFHELREMIGTEKTAMLVKMLGGTGLYIPSKPTPEHSLVEWLGAEIAQKVCAEFGGLRVEIPRMVELQRADRNARIAADRVAGLSIRQAALKYEMTERHVRNITNKHGIKAVSHAG